LVVDSLFVYLMTTKMKGKM
jgi:hypothetical protein